MSSTTANYGWYQPTLSGDATTWGSHLNDDLGQIDAKVYEIEQAGKAGGAPVGSIMMFAGATAPANWLICDGSSLSQGTYNALWLAIGSTYGGGAGTFNLPNLQAQFPMGAGPSNALGSTGGAAVVTLDATMIPAHSHPITDVTHTHTITEPPGGHFHTITEPPGGHSHGGVVVVSGPNTFPAGPPGTQLAVGSTGAQTTGINKTNNAITGITGTDAHLTGITATANSTGGGQPHQNLPPYAVVNFIIRAN